MGWLVGGLFEALVAFLCKIIGTGMSWVTSIFESALGADPTAFQQMFPITKDLQVAFKAIGFGLCIAFVMLGCARNMVSGLGFAGENPFKMFFRFFMAVVFVYTLPDLMSFFYTKTNGGEGIFQIMYDEIASIKTAGASTFGGGFFDIVGDSANVLTNGVSKVAANLIVLILMTVIAINFIKLLVEMFERYLLVNVLIFFAPLSASAITLESTMKVFSSYLKMFFGQMIMLLMNLISLKIIQSGMTMAAGIIGGGTTLQIDGISAQFMPFVALLLIIAMLKVLQHIDNYARDIGLTVGVTGGSLVDDILGTAAMFKPVMSSLTGGAIGGKKGGSGSGAGATSDGGVLGGMWRHSALGSIVTAAASVGGGVGQARKATGLDNANALDMAKYYSKNRGVKGFMNEVSKGTKESFRVKTGSSRMASSAVANAVLGKVSPDTQEKIRQGSVNDIAGIMHSSTPVKSYMSNARNNQIGFKNFANDLQPADKFVAPSVGVTDLSGVSVGNGGALGTNAEGDLIAVTTYEPSDLNGAYTSEYTDASGNQYWAQNLSRANDISMKENNGKEYTIYTKAQKAMSTGSTNYNFEGKAQRKEFIPNIPTGTATKEAEASKVKQQES